MKNDEEEEVEKSPENAIHALGSLFILTQIFIWDNGDSSTLHPPPTFPKHIRFKYDDDDDDDDVHDGCGVKDSSKAILDSTGLTEDVIMVDNEGVAEMSALGLPLSFQAKSNNQNNGGKLKAKSKVAQHTNGSSQNRPDEQVEESCEPHKEKLCCAGLQVKSSNSSSSSLPDQSEHSGCGCNINTHNTKRSSTFCERHMSTDVAADLICDGLEEHLHDSSLVTLSVDAVNNDSVGVDSQRDIEMTCVDNQSNLFTANTSSGSDMLDHNLKDDIYVTEQLNEQSLILGGDIIQPESSHSAVTVQTTPQPELPQLSEESQDMVVLDQEFSDTGICCGTCGDWGAYWDYFYLKYYFYNSQTKLSTWSPPPGMESFASGDSCHSVTEPNAELSGIDAVPSKPQSEELESIEDELIDKGLTSIDKTCDHVEDTSAYLSSALCSEESCVLDNNCQDVITSQSLLDIVEYNHTLESSYNGLPKQKTKKKHRRRKKSVKNNKAVQAAESSIDITKYWCQRYLLFSRFDDGIRMDEEGWFSVTPEAIAKHQASCCGGGTVIDCFAGVGGNAIQFAKTSKHVIAIDIDPNKIDYAYHNAVIYGVEDNIDFLLGDSLSMVSKLKADTVFLSPPWGGPDYVKAESYDIHMLRPYDGQLLFDTFKVVAPRIIMFLPRNVDIEQLAELSLSADPPWSLNVEKNFLNGKFKAVTAYFSRT